jgi:hypothetical protein
MRKAGVVAALLLTALLLGVGCADSAGHIILEDEGVPLASNPVSAEEEMAEALIRVYLNSIYAQMRPVISGVDEIPELEAYLDADSIFQAEIIETWNTPRSDSERVVTKDSEAYAIVTYYAEPAADGAVELGERGAAGVYLTADGGVAVKAEPEAGDTPLAALRVDDGTATVSAESGETFDLFFRSGVLYAHVTFDGAGEYVIPAA